MAVPPPAATDPPLAALGLAAPSTALPATAVAPAPAAPALPAHGGLGRSHARVTCRKNAGRFLVLEKLRKQKPFPKITESLKPGKPI